MAAKQASEKAKSPKVFGQTRKLPKMLRAGLFARVSTNDQQTIPLQICAQREYATCPWRITELGQSQGFPGFDSMPRCAMSLSFSFI
jgi:hypothetical protein